MTPDRLADDAIPVALRLVGAVRETPYAGVDETAKILDALDVEPGSHVAALLVVLAAMVDDARTPGELLAWTGYTPPTTTRRTRRQRRLDPDVTAEIEERVAGTGWTADAIRDAHADYQAGDRHDPTVIAGQKIYDRARHAVRRRQAKAALEQVVA